MTSLLFKYKKVKTPSQRATVLIKKTFLNKKSLPLRYKSKGFAKAAGRNNTGSITVRHQGGGAKQLYRKIDFKREFSKLSIVVALEYDPNRSGFIARMRRLDVSNTTNKQLFYYILAPENLNVGDFIMSKKKGDPLVGHALCISQIPVGTYIYNIPLKVGGKGVFARSAGTFGQILKKLEDKFSIVRLPSGEQRLIFGDCKVSIGVVSNVSHNKRVIGKAGRSRWLNKRPTVRGVAMNPVDHPHGGGEGKTSGGRPSVSLWGRYTKGQPTRKKYKINKMIIQSRKKSKK